MEMETFAVNVRSDEIRQIVDSLRCPRQPDFLVRCIGGEVKCYQKVLMQFSPYFAHLDPILASCRLKNVPVEPFKIIINFYETGQCTIERDRMSSVNEVAERLAFKEIHEAMEKAVKAENTEVTIDDVVFRGVCEKDEDLGGLYDFDDENFGCLPPERAPDSDSESEDSQTGDGNVKDGQQPIDIPGLLNIKPNATIRLVRRWTKEEVKVLMAALEKHNFKFYDDPDGKKTLHGKMKDIAAEMMKRGYEGDPKRISLKVRALKIKQQKEKEKVQKRAACGAVRASVGNVRHSNSTLPKSFQNHGQWK